LQKLKSFSVEEESLNNLGNAVLKERKICSLWNLINLYHKKKDFSIIEKKYIGVSDEFGRNEGNNRLKIEGREFTSEDQNGHLFLTFTDISVVKSLQEAKAESKYKEILMSTVSHELRTPTNAILSMLLALDQSDLSPQQKHFLKVAISSSHLLLSLISDIMVKIKVLYSKLGLFKIERELPRN
jgi:signal transduction histidine kinase